MFRLLAVFLALLLTVGPARAKAVSFDVVNPTKDLHVYLKPYAISARQKVEFYWARNDPCVGKKLEIEFAISPDGTLMYARPADPVNTEEERRVINLALYSIYQSFPFPPPPDGQGMVQIRAKLKSRQPLVQVDPNRANNIATVLGLLAAGTIMGFAIWDATKSSGSNRSSGYTNPEYEWVNWPHVRKSDGTFVQGYWRSKRNNTMYDNFSSTGNVNPFTGQPGWIVPTH
ncbi:MAG: hypothetical protein AB7W16_24175 [Candidatus Obscuribacterales bacterium]